MIRTSGASSVDHIINETSFLLTREIVDLGRPGVGVGVLEAPSVVCAVIEKVKPTT